MVLGEPRKGIKVTYCTDTRPVPLISEMAKNADLFVCEGMYGEKEKKEKAKQNRHMTIYEAADIGRAANVKEQWLTHYSPSFARVDQYMDEVTKIFDRVVPGKDRKSITLDFEEE